MNCGVVTDKSWIECSGTRYAGNGDTDFIIDSLFAVKKARDRRIYSDEVPMADKRTLRYFKYTPMEKTVYHGVRAYNLKRPEV